MELRAPPEQVLPPVLRGALNSILARRVCIRATARWCSRDSAFVSARQRVCIRATARLYPRE